jgi:hypothetical protein
MSSLTRCRYGGLVDALAELDGDSEPTDVMVRAALYNVIERCARLELAVALLIEERKTP